MNRDAFAPISKKKLVVYGCIAAIILLSGSAWLLYLETPFWRVLLLAGLMIALLGGTVAGAIWISGGRRSEVPLGPAGARLPVRLLKALPFMFAAFIIIQIVRLIDVLTSK
ncbi:hypothetical protein [Horticoccus sp. 23ND18S-11]|uniref:hypothetical protein n=1 Tax=Horticoccus sp. 23ND18S-11 TaxID=3391832 RepID=UPI0039C8D366